MIQLAKQEPSFLRLLDQAGRQRRELDLTAVFHIEAARKAWREAGAEARQHVLLVMANNPHMSPSQVLLRLDVRQALRVPFQEALAATLPAIEKAWKDGEALGIKHGQADLAIVGKGGKGKLSPDRSLLASLKKDARRNAAQAGSRFAQKIRTTDRGVLGEELRKLSGDLERRAGAGVDFAATRSHLEGMKTVYQAHGGTGMQKVWVTRFGPGTCVACAKLHGMVRGLGDPFPSFGKPGYGLLNGPPRHPNCRCRIVPWLPSMKAEGGANPETMRIFGQGFLERLLKALRGRRGR